MDTASEQLLVVLRRRAEMPASAAPLLGPEEVMRFGLRWHGIRATQPAGPAPAEGGPAPAEGGPAAAEAGPVLTEAGPAAVLEALVRLEGLPVPASVVEADLLPDRVAGYQSHWLDGLCAAGEVRWVGAGAGTVVLARRDTAALLFGARGLRGAPHPGLDSPLHHHIRDVLARERSCFFRDLVGVSYTDAEMLVALWDLAWGGEVTCDGWAPLRAVVSAGPRGVARSSPSGLPGARLRARPRPGSLRATGPAAGQGRWSRVADLVGGTTAGGTESAVDPAVVDPAAVAMADALLYRHGFVTGDVLRSEPGPGGWGAWLPGLDVLAGGGLARRGEFVAGAGSDQFALPEAVALGRAGPLAGVHLLSSVDPANACGVATAWPKGRHDRGPIRAAGAHVVMVDGVVSLYVERGGRGLLALRPPGGDWERRAAAALVEAVRPSGGGTPRWRRLALQRCPEELAGMLVAAGFVPGPKGLVLYG